MKTTTILVSCAALIAGSSAAVIHNRGPPTELAIDVWEGENFTGEHNVLIHEPNIWCNNIQSPWNDTISSMRYRKDVACYFYKAPDCFHKLGILPINKDTPEYNSLSTFDNGYFDNALSSFLCYSTYNASAPEKRED